MEENAAHESERTDPGFFGRLTSSLAVGTFSEFALGMSAVNSVYLNEPGHDGEESIKLRSWLWGGDAKYKYKPSRYTSLLIEAEVIARRAEQMFTGCQSRFRTRT